MNAINNMTEVLAINYILDHGFYGHELEGVDKSYFISPFDEMFEYMKEVEKETGELPSRELMFGKFDEFESVQSTDQPGVLRSELEKTKNYLDSHSTLFQIENYFDQNVHLENGWDSFDVNGLDKFIDKLHEDHTKRRSKTTKEKIDLKYNVLKWCKPDMSERLSTGFKEIDDFIGGLRKGSLTLIQGSTGQGKSWCIIQSMKKALADGKNVLFYSDEMKPEDVTKRLMSMILKVPVKSFDTTVYDDKWIVSEISRYGNCEIVGSKDLKSADKIDAISELCKQYKIDVLIVDGIKYLRSTKSQEKDYEQMEKVAIKLSEISQKLDIATICAIQSNRSAEAIGTSLGTVAGSYDMLGIASTVLTLNREKRGNEDLFILTVGKSRFSSSGHFFAYYMDWTKSSLVYVSDNESEPQLPKAHGKNEKH